MNGQEILSVLRKRHSLAQDVEVGIWSTFGANSEVKENGDGGRQISIVATTSDLDLDREVVDPRGADMSYWRQNGLKVFSDHNYGLSDVAGVVRPNSLRMFPDEKNPRGWKMVVGVMNSPIGDAVIQIARECGQIGASIMFRPMQVVRNKQVEDDDEAPERTIAKWLWIETSFTAAPCNVSCQGTLVGEPGKMLDTLEGLVRKGRVLPATAHSLGLPDSTSKPRRVIICRR